MKLAHPQLDAVFSTESGTVPTLVIENQSFFRSLLQDVADQIAGMEGETVLSQNDRVLSFSKYAELIDSYLGFSLNRKPLLNKILTVLEREAVDSRHYAETVNVLSEAEQLVAELSFPFPCSLICTKLTVGALLKSLGIEISEEYADPLEKMLDYMELVREFDQNKLFIFVNLRSYFPDEKVERFLESAIDHEFQILLIDGREYDRLKSEERVTVDKDLCEF